MPPEHFLDVDDAARVCGVSTDTIRRRLRAGEIPGAHRTSTHANAPWAIPSSALGAHAPEPDTDKPALSHPSANARAAAEAAVVELRNLVAAQAAEIDRLHHVLNRVTDLLATALEGRPR